MPNTVIVSKGEYKENYLQVGNDEWQEALKSMTYSQFALYLYLAGNANNTCVALSKEAFEQATGIKKTAFYDAIKRLKELGYLVLVQESLFAFYTRPFRENGSAPTISLVELF